MKDRQKKQQELDELQKQLQDTQNVFITGFDKLTVAQDFELRKAVRGAAASTRSSRTRWPKRPAPATPSEPVMKGLKGMSAVAFTTSDPVALAKALSDYAKANPTFSFKAGVVEGRVFNIGDIQALANMPSKEEIYAKLLYVIQAPAQQLVTALNGVGRNLAVVVDQGVKENKFSS